MLEMRVGLCAEGVDPAGVAARLRGVALVAHDHADCQAAAFVGPRPPSQDAIKRLLSAGKHVLLATDGCPPGGDIEAHYNAAGKAGVRFAAVNPDRFLPSRKLVRQVLTG